MSFKELSHQEKTIPFGTCIFQHLGKKGKELFKIYVSINETEKSISIEENEKGIPFGHSRTCPCCVDFDKSLLNNTSRIQLAVSVLLENTDTCEILLTRRPKHMRSFPQTWVVPGGGMDQGESLIDTLNREVKEEIGIDIAQQESEIIYAWESTFPQFQEDGVPRRQHFIVYYRVKVNNDFLKKNKIVPQKIEVDSYAWIGKDIIQKCFEPYDKDSLEEFDAFVLEDDEYKQCKFSINHLKILSKELIRDGMPNLSAAASYLFRVWLEKFQ